MLITGGHCGVVPVNIAAKMKSPDLVVAKYDWRPPKIILWLRALSPGRHTVGDPKHMGGRKDTHRSPSDFESPMEMMATFGHRWHWAIVSKNNCFDGGGWFVAHFSFGLSEALCASFFWRLRPEK